MYYTNNLEILITHFFTEQLWTAASRILVLLAILKPSEVILENYYLQNYAKQRVVYSHENSRMYLQ